MKRKYLTLLMFFLLLACVPEDHVLEIEIINNTAEPVKNLKVITAGGKVSFEADNLPAGQKIGHTLNISGNSADGEFTFRFSRSGGEEVSSSGSYFEEDGGYLKKILIFHIQQQGVKVEQKVLGTN